MILFHLILAHFIGDFLLQSNDLIKKKYQTWVGTFQHAMIILAITALAVFPFWPDAKTWKILGVIFVLHFIQDVIKVEIDKNYNPKMRTWPYFGDQFFHLFLILLLSNRMQPEQSFELPVWLQDLYMSPAVILALTGIILLSYTFEITLFQFKRKKHPHARFKPNKNGMRHRVVAFAIFTSVFLLLTSFLA